MGSDGEYMVNRLSDLADFLENDSLPAWLKKEIAAKQAEIFAALGRGEEYTISGPNGEVVKVSPKPVAA